MNKYYKYFEIFTVFGNNKRVLLYLEEEKIFQFDDSIACQLMSKKYDSLYYPQYFYPEVKKFLRGKFIVDVRLLKNFSFTGDQLPEDFYLNCKIGLNERKICELIRNDSLDEFIIYVNKNNINLNSNIKKSIYETNLFLIGKKLSLIECATFYGSIKIFQYLKTNNIELKPSLWLYAIHSNNAEMIQILYDNNIQPTGENPYYKIEKESVKCHNNDIVHYLFENYSKVD